jgi:hypothetical protein
MPLRLPCKPTSWSPGSVLHPYWGAMGFHRPTFDVFLITTGGLIAKATPHLDTGSDYTIFSATIAQSLLLGLPFPRQTPISGAAGTYASTVSFPMDGLVSLFVTDYREYCYLPRPLIGFHAPVPGAANQRSVLGLSGFLQYFRLVLDPSPPLVELQPVAGFAGATGMLPLNLGLHDFIRGLRGANP